MSTIFDHLANKWENEMSRTYRNCTKEGKPNDYAFSHIKISSHIGCYSESDKNFLTYLVREKHPGNHTVPKSHTQMLNRNQRTKDKCNLVKALKNECFDDWSNDKWFKNASHEYW